MPLSDQTASPSVPRPRAGEIWLTAFGAGRSGEPTKTRPALVLYADSEAKSSIYNLAIMVPLSATLQPDLARPEVVATPANGLRTNSVAVVKALRAVAVGRLSARLGTAEPGLVQAVREVVAALLDLP